MRHLYKKFLILLLFCQICGLSVFGALPQLGDRAEDLPKKCGRPAFEDKTKVYTALSWLITPEIYVTAIVYSNRVGAVLVEKEVDLGLTAKEVAYFLDKLGKQSWRKFDHDLLYVWENDSSVAISGVAPHSNSLCHLINPAGQRWLFVRSKSSHDVDENLQFLSEKEEKHLRRSFQKVAQRGQAEFVNQLKLASKGRLTKVLVTDTSIVVSSPSQGKEEDFRFLQRLVASILGGIGLVLKYTDSIQIDMGEVKHVMKVKDVQELKKKLEAGNISLMGAVTSLLENATKSPE